MSAASSETPRPVLQLNHIEPLLAHLDVEEALLRDARTAMLERTRTIAVTRAHERELDALLSRLVDVSRQRDGILKSYAQVFRVSEDQLTLGFIIRRCVPEAAMAVSRARRRITRLTREMQQLSSTTAWILQQSRQINLSLLDAVSGEQSSQRYNANGQMAFQANAVRSEARS
jgi:flagellar biosynthesis/type III secretory pathway chaperone